MLFKKLLEFIWSMEMKQINVGGMHASNVALGIMRMDALSDEKAAE